MDILFLLVPLSVVLVAVVGVFLFWAIGSGQFDELDDPATRVLEDDDSVHPPTAAPTPVSHG